MKIESILKEWEVDSIINTERAGEESINIPKLHHKYYQIFINEKLILHKLEQDYKELLRIRSEWYLNTLSEEELRENEWKPNPKKILVGNLNLYLESDQYLSEKTIKIAIAKEKVKMLESIISEIGKRSYEITNFINFKVFQAGGK